MIEAKEIWHSYPLAGEHSWALQGASLSLREGECAALVGANGSGKTTLGEILSGLLSPERGEVTIDGLSSTSNRNDLAGTVGLVFQNPELQFFCETVEEELAFGPENMGMAPGEVRRRSEEALEMVGLAACWQRHPLHLSSGEKRLVALASVLSMGTKYLLLDEPGAYLDPSARRNLFEVVKRLKDRGLGILFITQHMEEVFHADRVAVLENGRVTFQGTPEGFFKHGAEEVHFGLEVPPVHLLLRRLKAEGIPVAGNALTVEGALKEIREVFS